MKTSYSSALEILAALESLDGEDHIIRDGGQERVVRRPYAFSAATRMAIARNLRALHGVREEFAIARNDAIRRISGGRNSVPDDRRDDFAAEMADLAAQPCEFAHAAISESDLCLSENRIPPSVIAAILPLLDGGG